MLELELFLRLVMGEGLRGTQLRKAGMQDRGKVESPVRGPGVGVHWRGEESDLGVCVKRGGGGDRCMLRG